MDKEHNVIPFPGVHFGERYASNEYSRMFLAVLLKNISQTYRFDHQLAAEQLVPYLPGLHSLTKAVIQQIQSEPATAGLANKLLAESIINSFRGAGLIAG